MPTSHCYQHTRSAARDRAASLRYSHPSASHTCPRAPQQILYSGMPIMPVVSTDDTCTCCRPLATILYHDAGPRQLTTLLEPCPHPPHPGAAAHCNRRPPDPHPPPRPPFARPNRPMACTSLHLRLPSAFNGVARLLTSYQLPPTATIPASASPSTTIAQPAPCGRAVCRRPHRSRRVLK